ncbi:MAG: hypothetical protein H0V95_04750 [Actinobacteria bacterium]|nr:hypothetical protein [Actinomycetota bacterium]
MTNRRARLRVLAGALAASLALVATALAGASGAEAGGGKSKKLVGTFELDAGTCDAAGVATGSYFKMIQPGGTIEAGPVLPNVDSTCSNKDVTLLEPGTDGGLRTGKYQPQPDPAFDATGNGLADRIHTPTGFFGIDFASSTNKTDPQTGEQVPAITIKVKGAKLSGNTSAYSVAYGNQQFNQGAPKPDESLPGLTRKLTGTYAASTREFELEWVSQIVGGPFNDFTGIWHLEGTFKPSKG